MVIFRKIWAIYGVMLFLAMMVLSIPILLFFMVVTPGENALRKNIYYLHHPFTKVFLALTGIKMHVTGREHLDLKRPAVIVGNHRSAIDFIIHAHAYPKVFRFLAKQELLKVPIFGWVVGKMCLIVDRSSAMSRARSMVVLKQQLEAGWNIFIYPEGSRNQTSEPLAPFYDGAFRLAIQSKVPIAIVVIKNVADVTASARSVDFWPGVLQIHCKFIETSGYNIKQVDALRDLVYAEMQSILQPVH